MPVVHFNSSIHTWKERGAHCTLLLENNLLLEPLIMIKVLAVEWLIFLANCLFFLYEAASPIIQAWVAENLELEKRTSILH